jgi:uncharacterized repeat protein (TIGR03803 family)
MRSNSLGFLLLTLVLMGGGFAASKASAQQSSGATFKVLYTFTNGKDGCCILGGPVLDQAGNIYGIAYSGDNTSSDGDLFKLSPTANGYVLRVLFNFSMATGRLCDSTPAIDKSGNLFGVCGGGGPSDNGTLWEYSRSGTFTVLHTFTGPPDGSPPEDGVALDREGDIYGTARGWGPGLRGTFWEYSPSSGAFTLLHSFAGRADGGVLPAAPSIDENGIVWGTTELGPDSGGNGTVWSYDPSSGVFSTIQDFRLTGVSLPSTRLVFGRGGNPFGTAASHYCGQIYELPKNSYYAPVLVYQFPSGGGVGCAVNGRVAGGDGYLIGTTTFGGASGCGTVYELVERNGGWVNKVLHEFDCNDGYQPASGLATDHKGNWFGTAAYGGKYASGTVFEISGVQ